MVALGFLCSALSDAPAAVFINNAGFESISNPTTGLPTTTGGLFSSDVSTKMTVLDGWTARGWGFVMTPGSADTTGVPYAPGSMFQLWGPNNGSNNGLPATSPVGGNYLALDGPYHSANISQTLSGLTPGSQYDVSFWWAGAQQKGFTGATTESLVVALGTQIITTPILNNASLGYTGWQNTTLTFTAQTATDTLTFLAQGTPSGVPPFVLLDGISMTATPVPEPSGILMIGAAGVIVLLRRSGPCRTQRRSVRP
jgi:hypothetical protein